MDRRCAIAAASSKVRRAPKAPQTVAETATPLGWTVSCRAEVCTSGSGAVAHVWLALDQAMLMLALANYLAPHCIQTLFAADPLIAAVMPLLGEEHFFE